MKGRTIAAVLAVGLLAGCAWKESGLHYANYHAYLSSNAADALRGKMPTEAEVALAHCYADFGVARVSPSDLKKLDAAARGEEGAPQSLVSKTRDALAVGMGTTGDDRRAALQPYCPGDIALYGKYLD